MNKKYFAIALLIVFCGLLFCRPIFAQNGEYGAYVTTKDGTYSGTAIIEYGQVIMVRLEQGNIAVLDAKVINGAAEGKDTDGNPISIEIQDYY
jgi:hypothetical protein